MANETINANQYQQGKCEIIIDFDIMESCGKLGTMCRIFAGNGGLSLTLFICDECINDIVSEHLEWKITKLRKQ